MAEAKPLPPIDTLREVLDYNPETGELTWTDKATRHRGKVAGSIEKNGYVKIKINGERWAAHRICYALYHGSDPYPMEIDHDNRDRGDNSITNLVLATHKENSNNRGEYDRKPHIGGATQMKPVRLTGAEGEAMTVKSISLAAFALGIPSANLRKALHSGHGRICQGRRPTGLTIAYACAT